MTPADADKQRAQSATRWGDREQRRADILRAGEELLVTGGYDALRMRDVASGAGISLGAVYTYYGNKESLFGAVYAERLDRMLAELDSAVGETAGPVEAFTVFANMYRDAYPAFGRQLDALSLVADPAALAPDVEDQLRRATARLVTATSSWLIRFGYSGDVPQAMTYLWALVTGLANHFTTSRQEFLAVSWDDAVQFAAQSFTAGLGLTQA